MADLQPGSRLIKPTRRWLPRGRLRRDISGQRVVTFEDASVILEPTEGVLATMSFTISLLVETGRQFPVGSVLNDCPGAACVQPSAQHAAVIGVIAQQLFRRHALADGCLRNGAVMRRTVVQYQGKNTAFGISDCVDLRVASAARALDCLILLSPFAPDAEWCALTWVESIICVLFERPRDAGLLNTRSHSPRFALCSKRL